ncbi:four-carbon acid sugar kinase family protein [Galbibacter sp.]|uniref:four-carbon acid sugar kinase family protein n=1 Tax=Galbibacter sp. TaxID=2918471 RepID=UPI003A8EB259
MEPKLVFYGDDFTGATDALEFMTRAGAKTVLFLEAPTPEALEAFGVLDAIGIAGKTRAMPPEEMQQTLEKDFAKIAAIRPKHIHYKVCSTFDSSPEIGNIGVAITEGLKKFENSFVPIVVAAPDLGRYVIFGQLFAQMGIGSKGDVYRIDQHPSMSKHPVTPAKEADLRNHLALQADFSMGLIDIRDLEDSLPELLNKLQELSKESEVVFFDGIYSWQMKKIGAVLENCMDGKKPLFSVGSSGVEQALGDYWQKENILGETPIWSVVQQAKPMLVLCGSVSPITAGQIDYALEQGFEEVAIAPEFLSDDLLASALSYAGKVLKFLELGKSVIVHTARGPEDPRLEQIQLITQNLGWDAVRCKSELPKRFGQLLGQTADEVLRQMPLKRLIIAGGDTSSYTARALGIQAVQMIAPLVKGAPLCRVYAKGAAVDGMEINLKGGQLGEKDYFVALQQGILSK